MGQPREFRSPKTVYEALDIIQYASIEIVSAMSSLNMKPKPIKNSDGSSFLADTDGWCKHSLEHMHTAFKMIEVARDYLNKEMIH